MKKTLRLIVTIVIGLLIASAIISWIPSIQNSPIGALVNQLTDPLLSPIRKILPSTGGLDFSTLILVYGLFHVKGRYLR